MLNQADKGMNFCTGAGASRNFVHAAECLIKWHFLRKSIVRNTSDGCLTDASSWNIDDSFNRDIVRTVIDCFQVTENIFNFLSGIKVDSTDNPVRNALVNKFFLKYTGLCIGTV